MKTKFVLFVLVLMFAACTGIPVKAASSSSTKNLYLTLGSQKKLKVKGAKGKIKWKSSNKSVATVNQKGLVKTLATGSTTITATFKNKKKQKYRCKLRVCSMNTEPLTIKRGSSATLNVKGTKSEKWKSSNPHVATVSKKGKITPIATGSCTITGSIQDLKFSRTIKISGFKDNPIILADTGKPMTLSLVNVPGSITYKSSNENVARVEENKLIPVSSGSCNLTAYCEGVIYSCSVIIKNATPSLFIDYLETYHQYIKAHSDQFIRKYDSSIKNFDTAKQRVSAGETIGITCVVPCRWALYALGVKRSDGKSLLSCNDGTFKGQYTGGMKTAFDWIKEGDVIGLTLKEAVDKGYLRKGDIIGFKDKTHTFVYSGEGYMVYEGGNDCVVKKHYPNGIMRNYNNKYRNTKCKISEILRWKQ